MSSFSLHPQLEKDSLLLAELPLCQLRLLMDANYPWMILVPRIDGIGEIYQLSENEQRQLLKESSAVGKAMMSAFDGDKLNVAAIGNMVPQLHLHHVVRFVGDPSWPKPVWGQHPAQPYSAEELAERVALLKAAFSDLCDLPVQWRALELF